METFLGENSVIYAKLKLTWSAIQIRGRVSRVAASWTLRNYHLRGLFTLWVTSQKTPQWILITNAVRHQRSWVYLLNMSKTGIPSDEIVRLIYGITDYCYIITDLIYYLKYCKIKFKFILFCIKLKINYYNSPCDEIDQIYRVCINTYLNVLIQNWNIIYPYSYKTLLEMVLLYWKIFFINNFW